MCGRFYIPPDDDASGFQELFEQMNQQSSFSPRLKDMRRGEVFPTDIAPIITREAPLPMTWGFTGYGGKGLLINARLETAEEKPTFKRSFLAFRCLVPVGCYFEWQKDGPHKQKYAIGTGAMMTLAGLFRQEAGAAPPVFTILTRPAAPQLTFIHERMPVIIPESLRHRWLAEPIGSHELLALSDESVTYQPA